MYSWQVYKVLSDDERIGYVYARNLQEARGAWAQQVRPLNGEQFECIEDAAFYASEPEEGGYILFLSPDELVDFYIEADKAEQATVFYYNPSYGLRKHKSERLQQIIKL